MSLPRQVLPGATYLITRRCAQRQFLLLPSRIVSKVFLYCLAVAAERTGVVVHAVTVMSNHYHLIATDPYARLPEFYAWLHEFIGKALNAQYGRWENFWATEPTSCVRLVTPADVLSKTVYTLANPVAAGLVSHGDDWPGVRVYLPGPLRCERPPGFFRSKGPTPEVATLNIVAPPMGLADNDAIAVIKQTLLEKEAEVRAKFTEDGRSFLERSGLLCQSVADVPRNLEPRRELSPRVACRNQWLRIETLSRCKQFIRHYKDALRAWSVAVQNVIFPPGTYQMARRYAVAVAPS